MLKSVMERYGGSRVVITALRPRSEAPLCKLLPAPLRRMVKGERRVTLHRSPVSSAHITDHLARSWRERMRRKGISDVTRVEVEFIR